MNIKRNLFFIFPRYLFFLFMYLRVRYFKFKIFKSSLISAFCFPSNLYILALMGQISSLHFTCVASNFLKISNSLEIYAVRHTPNLILFNEDIYRNNIVSVLTIVPSFSLPLLHFSSFDIILHSQNLSFYTYIFLSFCRASIVNTLSISLYLFESVKFFKYP